MKTFLFTLTMAMAFSISHHAFAQVTHGPATQYEVTVEKIELCKNNTCTGGTFVISEGASSFDIAGVAAGAPAGSFGGSFDPPVGEVFTHFAVTVNRTFTVKGNVGTCRTTTGNNSAVGSFANGTNEASAATAAANAQTITAIVPQSTGVIATPAGPGANFPAVDLTNAGNLQFADRLEYVGGTDITAPSVRVIYAMTNAYTVKDEPPAIDITINTQQAVALAGAAPNCNMLVQEPDMSITIQ